MISQKILGVKVDFFASIQEVLSLIEQKFLVEDTFHLICTTNPEFIISAQKDMSFKDIINNACLSLPDGHGVMLAKKYLDSLSSNPSPKSRAFSGLLHGIHLGFCPDLAPSMYAKIPGVQFTETLCSLAASKGYTVCFLGGRMRNFLGQPSKDSADLAQLAASAMMKKYPGLRVICATSKFSHNIEDDVNTVSFIQQNMAKQGVKYLDFIFVAYNHVNQEKWLLRNASKLPVRIGIGVGGTFDYLSGFVTPCPTFVSRLGFEWLWRLLKQPWRYKRVFRAFPYFPWLVYKSTL